MADDDVVNFTEADGRRIVRAVRRVEQLPLVTETADYGTPVRSSDRLGKVSSPATLGLSTEGTETAATDTWSLTGTTSGTNYAGVPLEIWQTCRVVYNHAGDKKLYAFQRKLTFDTTGRLRLVSAETRVEVDAAGAC